MGIFFGHFFILLFEAGSLAEHRLLLLQLEWLSSKLQEPACLKPAGLGFVLASMPGFYMDSGGLSSGPHIWAARASSLVPPHPYLWPFLKTGPLPLLLLSL